MEMWRILWMLQCRKLLVREDLVVVTNSHIPTEEGSLELRKREEDTCYMCPNVDCAILPSGRPCFGSQQLVLLLNIGFILEIV